MYNIYKIYIYMIYIYMIYIYIYICKLELYKRVETWNSGI